MTPTQILAVRAAASPPPSGSAAGQVVAQGSTPVERPDPRQLRCTLASPGAGALRAQAVHAHPGRSRADHGTRAAGSGPNAARKPRLRMAPTPVHPERSAIDSPDRERRRIPIWRRRRRACRLEPSPHRGSAGTEHRAARLGGPGRAAERAEMR